MRTQVSPFRPSCAKPFPTHMSTGDEKRGLLPSVERSVPFEGEVGKGTVLRRIHGHLKVAKSLFAILPTVSRCTRFDLVGECGQEPLQLALLIL